MRDAPQVTDPESLAAILGRSRRLRSVKPSIYEDLTPPPRPNPDAPTPEQQIAWFTAARVAAIPGRLRAAGVALEHQTADLDDFTVPVRERVFAWLKTRARSWKLAGVQSQLIDDEPHDVEGARPHGLVVKGPPGTGKTRLALAILAYMLTKADFRVEWYHARALMRRLWSVYRDDATETEDDVLRALTTCPVLVIDDLGHEGRVSEAALGALHEILSTRIGDFRTTIITTNRTEAELARAYDAAVASRLGAWEQFVLTGDDRRRA